MKKLFGGLLAFSLSFLFIVKLVTAMAAEPTSVETLKQEVVTAKNFPLTLVLTSGDSSKNYEAEKTIFVESFTQAYLDYITNNAYPVLDKAIGIGAWIKDAETPEQGLRRTLDGVIDCNDPEDLGEIQQVQKGDCTMITAYHGQEVVGFITFKKDQGIYMSQLAVKSKHRRLGVATALIKEVLRLHPEAPVFYIIVRKFNTSSQDLYKNIGFTPSSYMRGGYSDKKYMGLELRPAQAAEAASEGVVASS